MDKQLALPSPIKYQEEDLSCPECLRLYNDGANLPRLLDEWGHSVCHECLNTLISKSITFIFRCPKCKNRYNGLKKATGFEPNFDLMKLVKNLKDSKENQTLDDSDGTEFQIFVMPLTGTSFPLVVKPSDKILKLKEKIWGRLGLAIEKQALLYNGRGLKDDFTVAKVSLKPNCLIYTVYRLIGGRDSKQV